MWVGILCGEDIAEEDFVDVGGFDGWDALEGRYRESQIGLWGKDCAHTDI